MDVPKRVIKCVLNELKQVYLYQVSSLDFSFCHLSRIFGVQRLSVIYFHLNIPTTESV